MPEYRTTSIDAGTVSLSALRSRLFDGPGAGALGPLASALRSAASSARFTSEDLDAVLRRDDPVHAGAAADGARAHLSAVRRDTAADAGRLDRAAAAVEALAGHHATARRDVVPAPDVAPGGSPSALIAAVLGRPGGPGDPDGQGRARHAVAVYQSACNDVLTRTMPIFDGV